jgi:hypothetical protein
MYYFSFRMWFLIDRESRFVGFPDDAKLYFKEKE